MLLDTEILKILLYSLRKEAFVVRPSSFRYSTSRRCRERVPCAPRFTLSARILGGKANNRC
jgi:hypothetical protein